MKTSRKFIASTLSCSLLICSAAMMFPAAAYAENDNTGTAQQQSSSPGEEQSPTSRPSTENEDSAIGTTSNDSDDSVEKPSTPVAPEGDTEPQPGTPSLGKPDEETPDTTTPPDDDSGDDETDDDETDNPIRNGWYIDEADGSYVRHWYDDGVMARSKEIYDPAAKQWLWIDADGVQARNKDVYLAKYDKWVRYDANGYMIKGREDFKDGKWYYFDPVTGAMAKGMTYLRSGNKWVYYDYVTGQMQYGAQIVDGRHLYFDPHTGRQWSRDEIINLLLNTARGAYGKNIDAAGELNKVHGLLCPYGPCMEWIWWVYHTAGLDLFLSDGATSGWPHHNFDWYRSRGRVNWTPQVGDLAFYKWPGQDWANDKSAAHAAIVVRVDHGRVYVADAAFDNIAERDATLMYGRALQGYAHPYYDE